MEAVLEGTKADYRVVDSGDNGEFLTWATLAIIYDGETVDIVEFSGSSEFPGEDALAQALSYGAAYVESVEAPYGSPEWEAREFEREIGDRDVDHRIVRERAWKVVEREIQTLAVAQKILDLRIGLRLRHARIELGEDDLGDRKAEGAGELAGDELRDERARTLPRSAELDDVRPVVVAGDDRRQRPAFAQRRHVLRRRDRANHAPAR